MSSEYERQQRDSRESLARHAAVMTVGTTLSRLTGFLRHSAMTAALGVTISTLGSIYTVANLTPNILYELILGGILTSHRGKGSMSTRASTERTVGQRAERTGVRLTGRRFETKWAPLTTEFWAMVGVIVATLIAAAVADNFDAPRAWVIVGFVAAAFIVSRGLAKAGTAHRDADAVRD